MDGHECMELMLSDLENSTTIGAEYYSKEFVNVVSKVKAIEHDTLVNASEIITDGDHGASDYQDEGVLYILSECVKLGYLDLTKARFITEQKHQELKRSALHPGDVIVTKTGVNFGISAVIPEGLGECNTIAHVGKITLKEGINPYLVSSFLNSRYGYYQMRRRGLKATRPEMKLVEMKDILIPVFHSGQLSEMVKKTIEKGYDILNLATKGYNDAVEYLEGEIGIDPKLISKDSVSIMSFSESFGGTGRFDAEYYQKKNYDVLDMLNAKGTIGTLCHIYDKTFTPSDYEEYKYIELANIGQSGEIEDVESVLGENLPTRARRLVKKGNVIVSSIEGSLESCAIITDEYDNAICSTGFYVIDSDLYNSETLLALLKSKPIQMLLKRGCSGTILTNITKDEFLNIPLPEVDEDVQKKVKDRVSMAYALREKSKELFESAKKAIEIAIENDETTAVKWLEEILAIVEA